MNDQNGCPTVFKDKAEKDVALWCAERMGFYDIRWSTEREIAVRDIDGKLKQMTPNHLKSIVRRDYIEQFGSYPNLCRIIDDIINYAMNTAATNKELTTAEQLCGKLSA
jgi:hypothetical protein